MGDGKGIIIIQKSGDSNNGTATFCLFYFFLSFFRLPSFLLFQTMIVHNTDLRLQSNLCFLAICIDMNMNGFVFIKVEIESHTKMVSSVGICLFLKFLI